MTPKRVLSITMVKNEADIIESFVRYHLNLFDRMVILDNKSTDNTLEVLYRLKEEGNPIDVVLDSDFEFLKSEKTTSLMYNSFEQYRPDIIFMLDADEFVKSTNNQVNPRELIEQMETDRIYSIGRIHYIPMVDDDPNELFIPKRITHAIGRGGPKIVFTKDILTEHRPVVSMGNHEVLLQGVKRSSFPALTLAHYEIRSFEQAKSKWMVGWLSNLSRYNRRETQSVHWKQWFDTIVNNPGLSETEFFNLCREQYYGAPITQEPINLSFCSTIDIKYTTLNEVDSFKNLIRFCETLAMNYAKLKKRNQEKSLTNKR